MFDIGFFELILLLIISIIILGPNKFTKTIQKLVILLYNINKKYINFKTNIENEIGINEIKIKINNNKIIKNTHCEKNNSNFTK